jgi:hypothetical protein
MRSKLELEKPTANILERACVSNSKIQPRDIASDDFDDAKDMERLETKILTPKNSVETNYLRFERSTLELEEPTANILERASINSSKMQSRDIASDDFDDAKDMERLETKILTPKNGVETILMPPTVALIYFRCLDQ